DGFSFKRYGIRRAERGLSVAIAHADRSGNLLERSCLGMQVVVAFGRIHVVIVRSAIQSDVSARGHLRGLAVVSDLIATKDIIAEIDLAVAVQQEEVSFFFLLLCFDSDRFA